MRANRCEIEPQSCLAAPSVHYLILFYYLYYLLILYYTTCTYLAQHDAGQHIQVGKVKAHMGVRGSTVVLADAVAKAVFTQKILNVDPDNMANRFSIQELGQVDQLMTQFAKSTGLLDAHEHDEWPVHPIPTLTCQGADDRHQENVEKMLIEGTWPDGIVRRALGWTGPQILTGVLRQSTKFVAADFKAPACANVSVTFEIPEMISENVMDAIRKRFANVKP